MSARASDATPNTRRQNRRAKSRRPKSETPRKPLPPESPAARLQQYWWKKGESGHPGRKPGSLNRMHRVAKEAFQEVFEMLGGVEGMFEWAKVYPTEFYRHYARLIPIQVGSDPTAPPPPVGVLGFRFLGPDGKVMDVTAPTQAQLDAMPRMPPLMIPKPTKGDE